MPQPYHFLPCPINTWTKILYRVHNSRIILKNKNIYILLYHLMRVMFHDFWYHLRCTFDFTSMSCNWTIVQLKSRIPQNIICISKEFAQKIVDVWNVSLGYRSPLQQTRCSQVCEQEESIVCIKVFPRNARFAHDIRVDCTFEDDLRCNLHIRIFRPCELKLFC